jgi:hypothetical protein
MNQTLMNIGQQPDPAKAQALVASLETAGVEEIGDNGTFYAKTSTMAAVATAANDAGFSIEVLGPGRTADELNLRVSQNIDAAPVDRQTLVSGKISALKASPMIMGPRQDVGH